MLIAKIIYFVFVNLINNLVNLVKKFVKLVVKITRNLVNLVKTFVKLVVKITLINAFYNSIKLKPNSILLYTFLVFFSFNVFSQQIAILEYNGGGDWYANPTALPNLIAFSNENNKTKIDSKPVAVKPNSLNIFNYPLVFITGHGNILFDEEEISNLRDYLTSGGFIHISDNYGIDKFIRREFKKIFPELEFLEVPFNHPIYHQNFEFDKGIPKIHEHDGKPPQGFGLFYEGQLVCFYDYESDLSDGWESQPVHNDPVEIRLKALQMGANIIQFSFTN